MNKSIVFGFLAAMVFMSGCAKKAEVGVAQEAAPAATVSQQPTTEAAPVTGTMSEEERARMIKSIEEQAKSIYFDFDKYNIRADMQSNIEQNAALFNKEMAKTLNIKIEGNCDEWGTDEYNYALGLKRAKSTQDALVAQGVEAGRITLVSYGESNPVCKEKNKECWQKNRRADFKILP